MQSAILHALATEEHNLDPAGNDRRYAQDNRSALQASTDTYVGEKPHPTFILYFYTTLHNAKKIYPWKTKPQS